jgi:peroxiredoxin
VVDVRNMKDATSKLAEQFGLSMPVAFDDAGSAGKAYGVVYTPTTVIVNPEGKVVFRHVGFSEGQQDVFQKEILAIEERT